MNRLALILLFGGVTYLGAGQANNDTTALVQSMDTFLQEPNDQDAMALMDLLPACSADARSHYGADIEKIAPENPAPDSDYLKLNTLAQRGDLDAIKVMFRMKCLFDWGAYAEDLDQDLGRLIDTHPREFLVALDATQTTDVEHVATMLGPDYVDDLKGQIKEYKRRIQSLKRVKAVPEAARAACLEALKTAVDELESIQDGMSHR